MVWRGITGSLLRRRALGRDDRGGGRQRRGIEEFTEVDKRVEGDKGLSGVAEGGAGGRVEHPLREGARPAVGQDDDDAMARGIGTTANDPDVLSEERVVAVLDAGGQR